VAYLIWMHLSCNLVNMYTKTCKRLLNVYMNMAASNIMQMVLIRIRASQRIRGYVMNKQLFQSVVYDCKQDF